MTIGELKGLVQSAIAELTLSSETIRPVLLPNIALWVKTAIERVDADLLWTQKSASVAGVAGQAAYAVPTGLLYIQQVTWNNRILQPITNPEALYAALATEATESTPTRFTWYGAELRLLPTPAEAGSITIWGVWRAEVPTDDSQEPSLPAHVHNIVVDYALYQAYRHLGEVERAQAMWQLYRAALEVDRSSILVSRGIYNVRRDEGVG